jgi:predicted PurR-regulated permease PerM
MTEPASAPTEEREKAIRRLQSERFSRYFLLLLLLGITVVFFNMMKVFLIPIIMAGVFAALFYPMYSDILKWVRNRRGLASFISCVILLLVLLVPLVLLGNIVSRQAVLLYSTGQQRITDIIAKGESGPLGTLKHSAFVQRFHLDRLNWKEIGSDLAKTTGTILAVVISKTSGGAIYAVAQLFIILFTIFYLFRDSQLLLSRIRVLLPLNQIYEEALIWRFVTVSRATIKGTVLIGLIQSTIGAITLWIFGVDSAALWFVVMLILSMIPLVGAWLVMHSAALIELLIGNVWQALGIFLVTVLIISTIDNVLRPRLVGQFTGLHDLLVFFSALGGLRVFGPLGVIIGPIVAAFFVTILEIYSKEFRSELRLSKAVSDDASPPL